MTPVCTWGMLMWGTMSLHGSTGDMCSYGCADERLLMSEPLLVHEWTSVNSSIRDVLGGSTKPSFVLLIGKWQQL